MDVLLPDYLLRDYLFCNYQRFILYLMVRKCLDKGNNFPKFSFNRGIFHPHIYTFNAFLQLLFQIWSKF